MDINEVLVIIHLASPCFYWMLRTGICVVYRLRQEYNNETSEFIAYDVSKVIIMFQSE